jgi:hypothetical protein
MVDIDITTTFLGNTDTPNSYTGQGGKSLVVKTDETGVEFSDIAPSDIPVTTALLATVGVLSFNPIYDNGVDGVGATLTATANGVLRDTTGTGKIDGSTDFENGDRVLVWGQVDPKQNGLYDILDKGSVSSPYVLERPAEYNEGIEFFPLQVNVISGNTNGDKIFLQQTENVEIGVSDIVFTKVETPSQTQQIRYIDTATSEPLPTFTYNPTTKIFTTDSVGYLGTINGLFATTNPNIAGGFTTFLAKDETEQKYNGSMRVLNTGSSTTFAQWTRIDTTANSFIFRQRTFMVSKVGSTLYGKQYFVQPNTPVLTTSQINIAPINFVEVNSQTLQNVSDAGGFDNGSTIRQGSVERFGLNGLELVCTNEKMIQWVDGREYYYDNGNPIVHCNSLNNEIPDSTYDETKSFVIGSRFTALQTGKTYICTDSTPDNAKWLPMGGYYSPSFDNISGACSNPNLENAFYSINNGIVEFTILGTVDLDFSVSGQGIFSFNYPIQPINLNTVFGSVSILAINQFNGIVKDGFAQFYSQDTSFIESSVPFVAKFTYQSY